MAGILDHQGIFYQQGILSTQQFRDNLLGRNLPPPVNETLTQSGLVSKLDDIGKVINVPIFGTGDENIPVHYNEDERMFSLGTFYRTTQNVNLNPYIPQDDEYITYNLTIPPNLPKPQPEEYGEKERSPYPTSYSSDRFELINKGDEKVVPFPFNVIDKYKSLNFQTESSIGIVGGQQLEKTVIDKISQVESDQTKSITEPVGNVKDNYVDALRGNNQFFNTLPNDAVGWNEYNSSNKINGGNGDAAEGVEPTMSTEIRMKTLLSRSSVEQVQFAFELLNRNPYRPLYEDRRLQGTSDEGTNGRYYIGTEKNTNRGATITKTFDSSDFNGEIDNTGNGQRTTIEGISEPFGEPNKFFWTTGGEQNFNEKTLLYKTQQLVDNNQDGVFINQTKKFFKDKKQDRLISRGNAISESLLIDAEANGNYCRVWTVNDRYSYLRAIRNTGLFTSPNGLNGFSSDSRVKEKSVLLDSGIPKYHPTELDSTTTRKKFMFSIENLAWADNLADLPIGEIGPGDVLSGNKGRIMWFPPYGLTFDENSNANWTSTDFIGRSEPVYTYNNTTRSASISFKILVDHPRVINGYRGKSNNLLERFFAGCVTPEDLLESLDSTVSQSTKEEIKKKIKEKRQQKATNLEKKFDEGTITYSCPEGKSECEGSDKIANNLEYLDVEKDIESFLTEQLTTSDPEIRITIDGYSSEDENKKPGLFIPDIRNEAKKNAKKRADSIKEKLKSSLGTKNIKYVTNAVVENASKVVVTWENDPNNNKSAQPKEEEKENAAGTYDPEEVKAIDSLLIDENKYFDFIDGNYPNYFKTISEKIKYFQPGFHSITPEGLNSRLTFLNQCMRQGPSIYDKGDSIQPQNLSFGRPPICILRIGDFFHTKIKINSLSISYDGPQFDLNPEGIGVQPMIASVQLSIDLIGGHSLEGPINRLQNAVSFNYYANTEVYEPRADSIQDGILKDGIKLGEIRKELLGESALNALVEDLKSEGTVKQGKDAEENADDADGNGDDVLEISLKNENTIIITTKDNKPPNQVVVNGKTSTLNKLGYKFTNIKSGNKNNTEGETSESTYELTVNYDANDLVNPTELGTAESALSSASQTLETAKNNFKTFKTNTYKTAYDKAQKEYDDAEEELKKVKKGKKDTIKVTAFLTDNKIKTKKVKTFTITSEGLT
jgi:hypothetical protein